MVSLPFMPTTGGHFDLEPPYLHHQWLREADWSGFVDSMWGWGITSGRQEGFVQGFRLAVAPGGVRADEAGVLVQEALPRWWLRVVDLARSALRQTRAVG